jgi:lipopolysaccharide heptosyltransferase I
LKILILKPSSLGDVVQSLPVLRLLKRHWPSSAIHWWLDADLVPLLATDPDLAGVIPFRRRRWASPWRWHELPASLRQIRAMRFDWVIDLQALLRSGLVAWLAGARSSVGLADGREGAPAFYDIAVPRPSPWAHPVAWYLETLRVLGVPPGGAFEWLPPRPDVAASVRARWNVGREQWVLIHPGARWMNKRWPVEAFAVVVRQLAAKWPEARFGVLGGESERQLGAALAAALPGRCLDLTATTSLTEMVEWIRLASLLITNDSGPMHVAAALRRPIVAIFGPTDPRRTGPYGQVGQTLHVSLPCAPCMKSRCVNPRSLQCLHEVTPAAVVAAAEARWGAGPPDAGQIWDLPARSPALDSSQ